jgi:hypothetical protein
MARTPGVSPDGDASGFRAVLRPGMITPPDAVVDCVLQHRATSQRHVQGWLGSREQAPRRRHTHDATR